MTTTPATPTPSRGLVTRGFTPPLRLRDLRLVAFDMDSTPTDIE